MVNTFQKIADYLFGYDFFISYAHADGKHYPQQLADQLTEAGYSVFLDTREYVAGVDLNAATRRRIRMSRKLIIIARPQALRSEWVRREVELCLELHGTPIVVDILDTIEKAPEELIVKQLLRDKIFIPEQGTDIDGVPSSATVSELIRSFNSTRQETLRLRFISSIAMLLLVIAAIAIWQGVEARRSETVAVIERIRSEDLTRIAVAENIIGQDPTFAALTLIEVENPSRRAISLMNEALSQPLAVRELRGHRQSVVSAHWNANEKEILTGSKDCSARVWQVDGSELPLHVYHNAALRDATWNQEGDIITASHDRTSKLWKRNQQYFEAGAITSNRQFTGSRFNATGDRIMSFTGFKFYLWSNPSISSKDQPQLPHGWAQSDGSDWPRNNPFSPHGKLVLTFDKKGLIKIWNSTDGSALLAASGQPIILTPPKMLGSQCTDADSEVIAAVFSPDGNRVAASIGDCSVYLWALGSEDAPVKLSHPKKVIEIEFSPDSRSLLTLSVGGEIKLWSLESPATSLLLQADEGARAGGGAGPTLAFSPQSGQIAAGTAKGSVRLWTQNQSASPNWLRGHLAAITSVEYNADGTQILTGSNDFTGRVWHTTGKGIMQHEAAVNSAEFSADGRFILTASNDGVARVWDGQNATSISDFKHDSAVSKAIFGPDGQHFLTLASDSMVRIWSIKKTYAPIHILKNDSKVLDASFSPDGTTIVTTDTSHQIKVWSIGSNEQGLILGKHTHASMSNRKQPILTAIFSPDSNEIISSSPHMSTARVWRADRQGDWASVKTRNLEHRSGVNSAMFGADGMVLTATQYNSDTYLWGANGNIGPFSGSSRARNAALSPDGDTIVTGYTDGTLRIFDSSKTQTSLRQTGHTASIHTVKFSPNSELVVSASADGSARIWSLKGVEEPYLIKGHTDEVVSASFSPDGQRVITASLDGTARLWSLAPEKLRQVISTATSFCLNPEFRRLRFGETLDQSQATYAACEMAAGRCPTTNLYLEESQLRTLLALQQPARLDFILKGASLDLVLARAAQCSDMLDNRPVKPLLDPVSGMVPCPDLTN